MHEAAPKSLPSIAKSASKHKKLFVLKQIDSSQW
jgi:hypothetical protein